MSSPRRSQQVSGSWMEYLILLGPPGVALSGGGEVQQLGSLDFPHQPTQHFNQEDTPTGGYEKLRLMEHLRVAGWADRRRSPSKRRARSNLSLVPGTQGWAQREKWVRKGSEQWALLPWSFFVPTRWGESEGHKLGGICASSPLLMLLFGSLSRVIQKQRVTSPSEICKSPPDLSTPTRPTGRWLWRWCLVYILPPNEDHHSSVERAPYS